MAEDEEPGAERSVAQKDKTIIRTNTVLAVSAILLSAISGGGVIWQAKVAADQRAATVWPYIQVFPARNSSPPFFAVPFFRTNFWPLATAGMTAIAATALAVATLGRSRKP